MAKKPKKLNVRNGRPAFSELADARSPPEERACVPQAAFMPTPFFPGSASAVETGDAACSPACIAASFYHGRACRKPRPRHASTRRGEGVSRAFPPKAQMTSGRRKDDGAGRCGGGFRIKKQQATCQPPGDAHARHRASMGLDKEKRTAQPGNAAERRPSQRPAEKGRS